MSLQEELNLKCQKEFLVTFYENQFSFSYLQSKHERESVSWRFSLYLYNF